MSSEGGEQQGCQPGKSQEGQASTWNTTWWMLLVGALLAFWLVIPPGEGWWRPGGETIAARGILVPLVLASMFLANYLLKYDDSASLERESPGIMLGLLAWALAFFAVLTTANEKVWVSAFSITAAFPLLIAVVRIMMSSRIKQGAMWPPSHFIIGLLMYGVATIVGNSAFHSVLVASERLNYAEVVVCLVAVLGAVIIAGGLGWEWFQMRQDYKNLSKRKAMTENNRDKKTNGNRMLNIIGWGYTVAIILVALWWILYNPGNSFGESETFDVEVFAIQTYPGQLTALQFTGTFIVVIGIVTTLDFRRFPDAARVTGIAGASVVMFSQIIQISQENSLLLPVVGVLFIYVGLVWLLIWRLGKLMSSYSRTKPRR